MIDGRYILNYLNESDVFWNWIVNSINPQEKSLEFRSAREGNQTIFHIAVDTNGFLLKLFKPSGLMKELKLIEQYEKLEPKQLIQTINQIVFNPPSS